jgi:ketosteroid isomerase-like protein
MDTRASIEAILDKAYDARRRNDAEGAAAAFCEDGCFMANGMPAGTRNRAEQVDAMKQMFAAFTVLDLQERCRIIDPPRAVVHWRGKFRAQNGQVGDTDILDLIEVRDGRIASLTTFYDTAYAMNLVAPPP